MRFSDSYDKMALNYKGKNKRLDYMCNKSLLCYMCCYLQEFLLYSKNNVLLFENGTIETCTQMFLSLKLDGGLVSHSQTAFSSFIFGWEEKGSGKHPI